MKPTYARDASQVPPPPTKHRAAPTRHSRPACAHRPARWWCHGHRRRSRTAAWVLHCGRLAAAADASHAAALLDRAGRRPFPDGQNDAARRPRFRWRSCGGRIHTPRFSSLRPRPHQRGGGADGGRRRTKHGRWSCCTALLVVVTSGVSVLLVRRTRFSGARATNNSCRAAACRRRSPRTLPVVVVLK